MSQSTLPTQMQTERFGTIDIDPAKVLHFVQPILGFDTLSRFVLLDHEDDSPFKWLQSLEDPELAFVVTNPTLFDIDYDFMLPQEACEALDIHEAQEAQVLTMVTVPEEDPIKMTVNLLGPLVYHADSHQAMQLILDPERYSTKVRLIADDAVAGA